MNNDLYEKALRFSKKWEHASYEKGQAQAFLLDFFKIFDLQDYKHPSIPRGFFEHSIQLEGGKQGFIDAYLPNKIMVEMKSQSVGLDKALQQLIQYHSATPRDEQPNLKLLCNFQYFLLIDTEHDIHGARFSLAELPDNIWRFHELVDRERPHISYEQIELDTQASQKMANIHAELRALAYKGHALELSLVRLLFCMFAEDTGIFPQFSFTCLVEKSKADGSDLHHLLNDLFEALDTPDSARHGDEYFAKFAYVNGGLFSEAIRFPRFNKKLREVLIDCCYFDWRKISPAIFGALFQGIMDEDERRQDGVHYTSEENILKVLNPLFLNALNERFEKIRNDNKKLEAFHQRLRGIKLLDPACGCGNFLLIAYRELRRLENRVIEQKLKGQATLFTRAEIRVDVDQCYGIELKAFPCEIARVALWLMDHLMMLETQKIVASYSPASNVDLRIPLTSSAKIVEANALTIDWQSLIDEENQHFDYIFGNPPFGGARHMSKAQKEDMKRVFAGCHHVGNIDYVGAWFYIAAQYMQNTATATAFVATNSISQGALVDILWSPILALGAEIDFAYRSFKWSNEAAGQAAVYCVIVGFSKKKSHHKKRIFEATNSISAKNINPYLVDAPNVLIQLRDEPINTAPKMIFGSMPNDGGHLIIEKSDYEEFVNKEPQALAYIRPLLGSREFLQKKERWCLWLVDAKPEDLRRCPLVLKRIEKVREHRLSSPRAATRKLADTPSLFAEIRQAHSDYLLIPRVSSENRVYIPMAFMSKDVITTDRNNMLLGAELYDFGIITSIVHMAWMRAIGGRLKTDYNYSIGIVYNTFPWPSIDDAKKKKIAKLAQAVLEARHLFPESSYASLYDPLSMPPALSKAHHQLDRAVLNAYGLKSNANEAAILKKLLELYSELLQKL